MIKDEMFDRGLELRNAMFGRSKGSDQVENASEFLEDLQELVTRHCFGDIWSRSNFGLRDRSLVTVAMLVALGREHELETHLTGALNNGVTPEEIRELLLHSSLYCGIPSAVQGFKIAETVLSSRDQ